jgi:hypothetical protein
MNQIGEFIGQYATKEVLTVIGALVTVWVGWKAAKGTYGMVAGLAKRASFLGLASAMMLAAGLGAAGLGVGELYSRPSSGESKGLSNKDLLKIALVDHRLNDETIKELLKYAEKRDSKETLDSSVEKLIHESKTAESTTKTLYKVEEGKLIPVVFEEPIFRKQYEELTIDPVKEAADTAEESIVSIPVAWSLIGLGFAASLSGLTVFFTRHNRRNTDDPNHPQYDSQYAKRA